MKKSTYSAFWLSASSQQAWLFAQEALPVASFNDHLELVLPADAQLHLPTADVSDMGFKNKMAAEKFFPSVTTIWCTLN